MKDAAAVPIGRNLPAAEERHTSANHPASQCTVEDPAEQTAGVECRKDAGVIDEIPAAY